MPETCTSVCVLLEEEMSDNEKATFKFKVLPFASNAPEINRVNVCSPSKTSIQPVTPMGSVEACMRERMFGQFWIVDGLH